MAPLFILQPGGQESVRPLAAVLSGMNDEQASWGGMAATLYLILEETEPPGWAAATSPALKPSSC